ncbi:ABC transporter g family member 24 [Phtheirospermum japonicum]|uniref:ABC transporter g family member 24 n=1 Tax=Phtheirospermum japonicum TaxID=374723 RepID=A0A830BW90_9LAMI|nr:ABC transporter g family member 24 [Phtheirospermum japonicum]
MEVSEYLDSLRNGGRPNNNCNSSHWVAGCEPGWACSTGRDVLVDLQIPGPYPQEYLIAAPVVRGSFAPPLVLWVPTARSPLTLQADVNHILTNSHQDCRIILVFVRIFGPMLVQTMRCFVMLAPIVQQLSGEYLVAVGRCITLTTCDSNAESQNIHAYGVMLIVSCSLPIVWQSFGCVEHHSADYIQLFGSNPHNPRTKIRQIHSEATARTVREKAQARARWKSAKESARKRSIYDDLAFQTKPEVTFIVFILCSVFCFVFYLVLVFLLDSSTQIYRAKSNEIRSPVLAPKKEDPKEEPVDNNLDKQQQVVVVGKIYIKLCYGRKCKNND